MEWLLDYNKSGIWALILLGILFVGIIFLFIRNEYYLIWKNDYYRDKDLLMKEESFRAKLFRMFLWKTY